MPCPTCYIPRISSIPPAKCRHTLCLSFPSSSVFLCTIQLSVEIFYFCHSLWSKGLCTRTAYIAPVSASQPSLKLCIPCPLICWTMVQYI
ncbi:hypothetical protein NEOLEDRAFT_463477 [Neolentinus lepideus HHB14362 ss-1]|uniref:Uncharacterized protein n=1 Tax=Neolentinus lepideus HHB14362 ss-1 TaxID=1314782 RepID=A0A165VHL0_9AGAM|nr:hypothetical protein NEOLEDRAFT_463477 [Neolentinus lepideus HHB14362 ss-1]